MKRLRGKKGTKVKVGIARKGEPAPLDFAITRDKIPIYSVEASLHGRTHGRLHQGEPLQRHHHEGVPREAR